MNLNFNRSKVYAKRREIQENKKKLEGGMNGSVVEREGNLITETTNHLKLSNHPVNYRMSFISAGLLSQCQGEENIVIH